MRAVIEALSKNIELTEDRAMNDWNLLGEHDDTGVSSLEAMHGLVANEKLETRVRGQVTVVASLQTESKHEKSILGILNSLIRKFDWKEPWIKIKYEISLWVSRVVLLSLVPAQ